MIAFLYGENCHHVKPDKTLLSSGVFFGLHIYALAVFALSPIRLVRAFFIAKGIKMHGSLSPDLLKQECFLVGRLFNSKPLGRLLWSLVLQESKAGTAPSKNGGVCSISFRHFEQMKKHHSFLKFNKRIKAESGLMLDRIQYQQLASCPVLSLIVAAAWFMANVARIPRDENEQGRLISRFWTHNTQSFHA